MSNNRKAKYIEIQPDENLCRLGFTKVSIFDMNIVVSIKARSSIVSTFRKDEWERVAKGLEKILVSDGINRKSAQARSHLLLEMPIYLQQQQHQQIWKDNLINTESNVLCSIWTQNHSFNPSFHGVKTSMNELQVLLDRYAATTNITTAATAAIATGIKELQTKGEK